MRYYGIEHIGDGELSWPIAGNPNWHLPCENGHRSLRVSPPGQYLLANRFAPNDREPRASACVFTEAETTEGFVASDRTNVIRTDGPAGRTLDHETVLEIATWINSAVANNLIGAQLGSTQLNANDLTNLPVPAVADLRLLAKRRSPGAAGEIEISKLLQHAMDDETRKAARTVERLDRVRRRMREAAPRRLDLHEDTTALVLMALTDHESVTAEGAGPAIVTLIKLRFGRHLEDRAARHVDQLAVPWILRTGIGQSRGSGLVQIAGMSPRIRARKRAGLPLRTLVPTERRAGLRRRRRPFLRRCMLSVALWLATGAGLVDARSMELPGVDGPDRPRVDDTTVAAGEAEYGALAGRPRVRATRTDAPPEIDGRLDDELWRTAAMLSDFVQQSPLDGAPATEETEVYIAYDRDHIYFAFYLHYADPGLLRANRVDRDTAWEDDVISVYLDTFMDQQRCYDFDLNGYNVQGDGVINAGVTGGDAIPIADRSWDALFHSGARIVEDGYTAEMAIPFKSLRYPERPPGVEHRWGF